MTTPDCVHCRRQVCADYRTCQGELVALCERVAVTAGIEERHRQEQAVITPDQWETWQRVLSARGAVA